MPKVYLDTQISDLLANPLRAKFDYPPNGDKRFAMSWTKLDMFDQCPFKYNAIHLEKSVVVEFQGEAAEYGDRVHKAAEAFLRLDQPIPEEFEKYREVWEAAKEAAWRHFATTNNAPTCEDKWAIDINGKPVDYFNKKVFIRGQSDYTFATGTKVVPLDWKTGAGKYPKTGQLDIMALLAKAQKQYKKYGTFRGALVFLDADKMVHHTTDLTTEQKHADALAYWQGRTMQIIKCYEEEHFPKKTSPLCAWCPVGTCEYNTNPNVE